LCCGIDLPLQPALSEPRVPNGVLHLGVLLKPPLAKSAERTITALAFNSMSASQIARFSPPSTAYEVHRDRISSTRCRASSPRWVTARMSRKAPLARVSTSPRER
jgi:hypothetical protein